MSNQPTYRDSLRSQIQRLTDQISDMQSQRTQLRQQLAEAVCPFKVGDRIHLIDGNVEVHISQIVKPKYAGGFDEYELFVRRLRKDGGLYNREDRVYWPSRSIAELQKEGA